MATHPFGSPAMKTGRNAVSRRFRPFSAVQGFLGLLFPVLFLVILWKGVPPARELWRQPRIPMAGLLRFTACYLVWTGLRGLRYWLLLGRPRGALPTVLGITFVHHAAIDLFPFRAGVAVYPILVRIRLRQRWRGILASLTGASFGDALAATGMLAWLHPGGLTWGLTAACLGVLIVGAAYRRELTRRFRKRHRLALNPRSWSWRAWTWGSVLYSRHLFRSLPAWFVVSAAVIAVKFTGLADLFHTWRQVQGAPALPPITLFLAVMFAELSREIPWHGWLHFGTWEWAWAAVAGSREVLPYAFLAHLSYEAVVLLAALPALAMLGLRPRRVLPGLPPGHNRVH